MTYMHKGRQFIVTAVGSSFGAYLLAFALPGSEETVPLREGI